ncbi:hypothetical protein [Lacinutrix sp. Hel_I_90]|uniref:hypothetical protein n=1 Tax=Lacinutrix sp. Hel_I_90 TaxID=1249999 RepID=UPI0005C964FA|nr:hypothetical protein [Lacinutrix sp. Hel_I_90]
MKYEKLISKGFIAAGLSNVIGVPLFSKLFTNAVITTIQPEVMSNFGLLMILVWGLAYIAVSQNFKHVKWLIAVFAIEKIIYAIVWLQWLLKNELSRVFEQDTLTGIFYSIYGINDFLFFIFFSIVFYKLTKQ